MPHDSSHPSDTELLRAIDAELTPREAAALDDHLAGCPRCREQQRRLERASSVFAAYAAERAEESSAGLEVLRRRLAARLADASTATRSPVGRALDRLPRDATSLAIAAACAAMLLLASIASNRGFNAQDADAVDAAIGSLPIRALTPGSVEPMTAADLCSGRTPPARELPASVRAAILHDYRMDRLAPRDYELDYLITPELGGATDRQNMWPQRYASGVWNARVKDELEELLPRLVCSGALDLRVAQRDMATNWIAAYKKYFHTERPNGGDDNPRLAALVTLPATSSSVGPVVRFSRR